MKKTLFAISAIAVLFGFTACTSENETLEPQVSGKTILKAYTEEATRTALSGDDETGYKVVWSEGDAFKIGENTFTLEEGAGTTSGKFTGTATFADDTEYTAYYPTTYDGTNWPTAQTYTAGNITGSPMKATFTYTEGVEPSLSFVNVGGILRLTAKGEATVRCITINATELSAPIILDCGSGVALTSDGIAFHIAMPANTYTGVTIKLIDTDSKVCTKTFKGTGGLKIESSKIATATFTVGEFTAPLTVNDHPYVELAGYYWATKNVYNATVATEKYIGTSAYGSYYTQSESKKAAASWGGTWTLPTEAQWTALLDGCTWTWQTEYEFGGTKMSGYLVSDKTDSSKFIFLPAAGFYWSNVEYLGINLLYWCSDELGNFSHEKDHAREFYGTSTNKVVQWGNQDTGFPVRPVAAKPTKGTAKATINSVETDVNWVQLWENGPKFAEYNVGVTDGKAESYGEYYAWTENVASTEWGSAWRMPTSAELQALIDNCTYEWTTVNDVPGRIYTGKGSYSSNSIFLPAAGYISKSGLTNEKRSGRYWSSNLDPFDDSCGVCLYYYSSDEYSFDEQSLSTQCFITDKLPVRAVLNESAE